MAVLKDRVPTKPNRKKLTFEDDSSVRYAMVEYADEPVEAGTAVNKQNVIDTALSVCDPLSSIGDIKASLRTSLGDNWLLCNGAVYDKNTYPILHTLLPRAIVEEFSKSQFGNTANKYGITYFKNKWFWVMNVSNYIGYSSDLVTDNGVNAGATAILNAIASNDYYVCAVGASSAICYSSTGTSAFSLNSTSAIGTGYNVHYFNGYWVIASSTGIWYRNSTDPTGTFTKSNLAVTCCDIHYANGYWVATSYNSGNIYYTTDITSTWTTKNLGASGSIGSLRNIYFGNGYWVAVSNSGGYISYINSTDPSGDWTTISQGTQKFIGLIYADGYWVTGDAQTPFGMYLKKETPDGTWEKNSTTAGYQITSVAFEGDYWLATAYGGYIFLKNNAYVLPIISNDKSFAYIKGK